MLRSIAILLLLPTMVFAQADPTKPTALELEGSYDLKQLYEDGKFSPQDVIRDFQEVTISNGELTLRTSSRSDTAKFTVEPTKKIAEIDLQSPDDKTKTIPGIYKFDKGELMIVFHKGGVRPVDFKGEGKDTVRLILSKRPPKKEIPKK